MIRHVETEIRYSEDRAELLGETRSTERLTMEYLHTYLFLIFPSYHFQRGRNSNSNSEDRARTTGGNSDSNSEDRDERLKYLHANLS